MSFSSYLKSKVGNAVSILPMGQSFQKIQSLLTALKVIPYLSFHLDSASHQMLATLRIPATWHTSNLSRVTYGKGLIINQRIFLLSSVTSCLARPNSSALYMSFSSYLKSKVGNAVSILPMGQSFQKIQSLLTALKVIPYLSFHLDSPSHQMLATLRIPATWHTPNLSRVTYGKGLIINMQKLVFGGYLPDFTS